MKKIFITNTQKQLISEDIELNKQISSLSNNLLNDIDSQTTSLSKTGISEKFLKKSLINRIHELESLFTNDISSIDKQQISNKLSKLIKVCKDKERNIRPNLEKLCFDTVSKIFCISDSDIAYENKLVEQVDPKMTFSIHPIENEDFQYETYDDIAMLDDEISKRRIVNALAVGGAIRLFDMAKQIYLPELFELDEELPHLYSKIVKLNEYLVLTSKINIDDNNHMQSGYTKVKLGEESSVYVEGETFPMLLIESFKGMLELVGANCLPKSFSKSKLVIEQGDALEYEPWDMRIGPVLWDQYGFNEIDTKLTPYLLKELAELDTKDFLDFSKEITHKTLMGEKNKNTLIQYVNHNDEKMSFDNDMNGKRLNSKVVIAEDDYFTPEELM